MYFRYENGQKQELTAKDVVNTYIEKESNKNYLGIWRRKVFKKYSKKYSKLQKLKKK